MAYRLVDPLQGIDLSQMTSQQTVHVEMTGLLAGLVYVLRWLGLVRYNMWISATTTDTSVETHDFTL